MAPEDIVAAADQLLNDIGSSSTPGFIKDRMDKLRLMIHMLSDIEWRLPHEDATRVLNALAYFTEPDDLIPDQIPGLGFLDDAIMVELVVRELKHEIEAFQDFCEFRDRSAAHRGRKAKAKRDELQSRMRRRRERSRAANGHSPDLRLFD
jgi:uncharacterized membrane protein YkvA (DUF1232 family)